MVKRITKYTEYSWLIDVVDKLKKNTIIENNPITIYVQTEAQPNAWVYPTSNYQKSLTVTTGLLYNLSKSDIETVISHELGHLIDFKLNPELIKTGDFKRIEKQEAKGVLDNLFGLFSNMWNHTTNFVRTIYVILLSLALYFSYTNSTFDNNTPLIFLVLVTTLLVYKSLDYYYFERQLEHHADLKGAYLTNNHAMIKELSDVKNTTDKIEKGIQGKHYKDIEKSLGQKLGFVDHPTTEQRINYVKKYYKH